MNNVRAIRRLSNGWERTLVPVGSCIKDAINSLNKSSLQVVLVVDQDRQLLGTITDGDIRRGLLHEHLLSDPVEFIMHKEPLVALPEMNFDTVCDLMEAYCVRQVPVLDNFNRVTGMYIDRSFYDDSVIPNAMIIMCGGRGTRMLPRTEHIPKSMLPINGKPILEHIINKARRDGFYNFVLVIHHLGDVIERHFGDGESIGTRISYIKESFPMGTAGGLSFYAGAAKHPVVVTNGDVLSDVSYRDMLDFHERHSASATMAVRRHEWTHPFGVVSVDGVDISGFEEKPVVRSNINAGIYVLDPSCLAYLKKDEYCDMPDLFTAVRENGSRTIAYPIHESWRDIGSPKDYDLADSRIM